MKVFKPYTFEEYAQLAIYCNAHNRSIVDRGEFLEDDDLPEKTTEEKQAEVREIRNDYLLATDKFMISDYPIDEEKRDQYRQYRQYLRDYTLLENWYNAAPKKFDEWQA